MLASSSRVTLNVLARGLQAPRASFSVSKTGHKSLSSQTTSGNFGKRQVVVELLQDVIGLGIAHDRIAVNPGRARHELVGAGRARYVPWKRPKDKQLTPRLKESGPVLQEVVADVASGAVPEFTPQEVDAAKVLALPPRLIFPQRTTAPEASTIHGSFTLTDVMIRLNTEYDLTAADVEVSWADKEAARRIKELGTWKVLVQSKQLKHVEAVLEVELVALQD